MSADLLGAVIAGASAVGGGLVVARSNYFVHRLQARAAEREELRIALSNFLALLNRVHQQLRLEPSPGQFVKWLNEQMARFPQLDYTIGQTRRRLFEPHVDTIVSGLHSSIATLVLIAPNDLHPQLEEIARLMEQVQAGDDEWRHQWERARTDLIVESRRVLQSRPGLLERARRRLSESGAERLERSSS